jgi:hypothetical protein
MIRPFISRFLALGAVSLSLLACDGAAPAKSEPLATTANVSAENSLLQGKNIDRALKATLGPLTPPIRLLSIVVLPSQLIVQVQNLSDQSQIHEFRYRDGKLEGPVPVKLLGKGSLKDNLFNLEAADPHMASQVLASVRAEYSAPIRKLVMIRNLPASLDIQFRAYLNGKDGDLVIAADKQGRLLGPIPTPVSN